MRSWLEEYHRPDGHVVPAEAEGMDVKVVREPDSSTVNLFRT
jgi:hypothetical protein